MWVAEQSCQKLPLHKAVAINGTPYPASPQYGLRLKVLQRTIRSVATLGGNAFKDESTPEKYAPAGTFEEPAAQQQVEELDFLADACQTLPEQPHLPWSRAWIATRDEIFPPAHMISLWFTDRAVSLILPSMMPTAKSLMEHGISFGLA